MDNDLPSKLVKERIPKAKKVVDSSINTNSMFSGTRHLAAIMFTDIVGYTALMQKSESKAVSLRQRHREILEDRVSQHGGKILQYLGDGSLSSFASALEAVEAAIEIQQSMQSDPAIPLRIGIHTGDVLMADSAVYGDGVNIASRIESMALPGSVLISGRVQEEIANQPHVLAQDLGTFQLKNVNRATRIYAVSNDGLRVPVAAELKGKQATRKSIAVLPFQNMSSDPDNEFFSDGITEEILNVLTRIEGLMVISRTSAFAYKGLNKDIREIGKELGVGTVLEGSVRKAGNRVRVTAQLINAADGYHIFSETYDRTLDDIFEIQDDIAGAIANRLRENFDPQTKISSSTKDHLKDMEAYELFLKGKHHMHKGLQEDWAKATSYFKQAVAKQPDFSDAYASQAMAMAIQAAQGLLNPKETFPKVKKLASKGLALDPRSTPSHVALGMYHVFFDGDWDSARSLLLAALKIDPGQAETHYPYAMYNMVIGEFETANYELELACQLDPASPILQLMRSASFAQLGRFEEALEIADQMIRKYPGLRTAIERKGSVLSMMGRYDEAIPLLKEYQQMVGHPLKGWTPLGYAYALMGEKEKALEIIELLKKRQKLEPKVSLTMDFAMIYGGMQDYTKAFEYLEEAIQKRVGTASLLFAAMSLAVQSDDTPYQKLLARLGIDVHRERVGLSKI